MLTEQTHTEPNWKLLPGTILDGGYEMQELLEADERKARFKIRVLGDRTIDAFASFFPVSGTAAQEQIEAWELLRRVPHANVSKPLAAGRRELDGAEVVYVVLRNADETLNGVLGERALKAEEATEVLLNGARALEHLSRHGLVHGSLSPEQVLAVGDSIQLSAEGVRKADGAAGSGTLKAKYVAPESSSGNATTAAAVWCLGATVFETLTQKACAEGCREEAKQLPLGWVLDHCLDPDPSKRSKPEEIPALVKSGPPPKVVPPAPVPAGTPSATVAAGEESKAATSAAAPGAAMPTAAAIGVKLPAAAASAASASAAGATVPTNVPGTPSHVDTPQSRPATSSLSQARTKVFKQAEFDALTSPQAAPTVAGGPRANGSAVVEGSIASPAFGAPQLGSAGARTPITGAKFDTARAGSVGGGSGQAGPSPSAGAPREFRGGLRSLGPEPEGEQRSRLWIYAAAAFVALLLIIWASRSKTVKTPSATPSAATSASPNGIAAPANRAKETAGAATGSAWPTRTLEPEKSTSAAGVQKASGETSRPVVPSKADGAAASSGAVWRVVVYTFNRQEDAEKRVRTLNSKHPHLQAQVFSPAGHSAPYLVTVGGRMTREDAARFRSKALGSGMPRDSYMQNFRP
jgi:hypothetical protein